MKTFDEAVWVYTLALGGYAVALLVFVWWFH